MDFLFIYFIMGKHGLLCSQFFTCRVSWWPSSGQKSKKQGRFIRLYQTGMTEQ